MNRLIALVVLFGAIFFLAPPSLFAISIPTVPVGNPGNAAKNNGRGAVAYNYRIGTYEVTNDEYVAFLNAKAASDPLGLYNTDMDDAAYRGGITRSGVSGSYTYAAKANMGNKPVNIVSWYDSVRFTNWLNNGQGNGDTETGAYTLLHEGSPMPTPIPSNGTTVSRNVGATWVLPTLNEWYKAAFYQPAAQGGSANNYWEFATKNNFSPREATAINTAGPNRGNIANPGPNVANYHGGADWNIQNGNVTTVGSAGPQSQSFYGTSDQAGNITEWNESPFFNGLHRDFGGGSFLEPNVDSSVIFSQPPESEGLSLGFRVAMVPEPSSLVLAAIGLIGVMACAARAGRRHVIAARAAGER